MLLRQRQPGKNTQVEQLIEWLGIACSAELAAAGRLEELSRERPGDRQLAERLRRHAGETRRHAVQLKECVERIGHGRWFCDLPPAEEVPRKRGDGTDPGLTSPGSGPGWEVWEAAAAEQGEMAMYTALISAASTLGFHETVRVCNGILEKEKQFSYCLLKHVTDSARQTFRPR